MNESVYKKENENTRCHTEIYAEENDLDFVQRKTVFTGVNTNR